MNSQFSVPIPTDLYIRVEDFLRAEGKSSDPVATIAQAVDNWIKQVQARPLPTPRHANVGQWSDDWIMFGSPPQA